MKRLILVILVGMVMAVGAMGSEQKLVALIAGGDSHEYGGHEHYAGFKLVSDLINENVKGIKAEVYKGWPADPKVLEKVSSVVIFSDGGGGSILVKHMKELEPMMARGVGLGVIHWALEVPKGEAGNRMLDWIGGYYECNWSVNPFWTARFEKIPEHPVTRGVRPFAMHDEWYYHMRFREKMDGVLPVLTAVPPDSTHEGGDSAHGGNAAVRARKGVPEHVAWVYQRPDGGRGFGFTGLHDHWNWAQDDYRKLLLNAIVWSAGVEVPKEGVKTTTPGLEQLQKSISKKQPDNWNKTKVEDLLKGWAKQP